VIHNMYKTPTKRITTFLERVIPSLYERYGTFLFNRYRDFKYKKVIEEQINDFYRNKPLFRHVEIETINRCNNVCSFCPVNKHADSREFKKMEEALFYKIIDELEAINYDGVVALHSNNEPLLDERLSTFITYARKKLPKAKLIIFTNGILLTKEIFHILIENMDEIVIDNYHDDLKLVKPVYDYIVSDHNLYELAKKKLKIDLRKQNEILTSRGGSSPNRRNVTALKCSCYLPFNQMVIRPDGKISLCCNDALGKFTLGDLNQQSMTEVWNSDEYNKMRDLIRQGRDKISICKNCDTLLV